MNPRASTSPSLSRIHGTVLLSATFCALVVPGGTVNAQCALNTEIDGYSIGIVTAVEYAVTPERGCVASIAIDALRSNKIADATTPSSHPSYFTMLGGFCDGSPVLDTTCPGGSRTFSFAIGELVLVAFCEEAGVRWIVDKRTCWSTDTGRSVEEVSTFLQEVRHGRRELNALRAYEGFSLEVLRSPDPSAFYAKPNDTTAWFLHQVHESSSWVTVAEYVTSLDLEE